MSDIPGGGYFLAPPEGYTIPGWPGLYLPWKDPNYLFYPSSIWRYTIYWSLLLTGLAFFLCGSWACFIFSRRSLKHFKYAIWLPVGYCLLGGIISLVTGTVIGFALGQLLLQMIGFYELTDMYLIPAAGAYNAAYLRMSTWTPFLWSAAQTLVIVIGSYSTITFLL